MKILFLLLALSIAVPAFAAQTPAENPEQTGADKSVGQAPAKNNKADSTPEAAKPEKKNENDGEFACKYYTVKLPDSWKAIMPPTDKQGTVNAIFAGSAGTPVVTIIVGSSGGADVKTIAGMFAEQFKAPKPPVEKNGVLSFSFPLQNTTAHAYVAAQDKVFMVTTISGNARQARDFIKKSITSENYSALLPQ